MREAVLIATSPIILLIVLSLAFIAAFAINISKLDYSVLKITHNTASGVGLFLIIVIAITFTDLNVTCDLLIGDRLLQFEFVVISFFSLANMGWQYIRDFDRG